MYSQVSQRLVKYFYGSIYVVFFKVFGDELYRVETHLNLWTGQLLTAQSNGDVNVNSSGTTQERGNAVNIFFCIILL